MIKIFIDFDGTISRRDVGRQIFETFGGEACRNLIGEFLEGRLSAVDCFRRECAACGAVAKKDLDDLIDRQEIDDAFGGFLGFCDDHRMKYVILSDGMDYYIGRIMKNRGFGDVLSYSNHLDIAFAGDSAKIELEPRFPYTDEECDRCACCKRNQMLTLCSDTDIIVYVGEGYSDFCPVRYADVVFAKGELLRYCRDRNIPCVEYATFSDILQRFKSMLNCKETRKNLLSRKRRQAQLAFREVFLGG